tara:strand:- start:8363 stop:8986 length:624 start_codon:yes stop_codon:yes gene_type:complete
MINFVSMNNERLIIAALITLLTLSIYDTKQIEIEIDSSEAKIEALSVTNKNIYKELKKSKKSFNKRLDSLSEASRKDSLKAVRYIKKIDRLTKEKVKAELLKDIVVAVDSSETILVTSNEAKGILKAYNQSKLNISRKGFKINKLAITNQKLNKSILLKDNLISNKDSEIIELGAIVDMNKKVKRKQIIKISVTSFILGAVTVAILK